MRPEVTRTKFFFPLDVDDITHSPIHPYPGLVFSTELGKPDWCKRWLDICAKIEDANDP